MKINPNVSKLIGNTPLIPIFSDLTSGSTRILAKYEGYNLTGSIKDRIVFAIISDAIEKKLIDTNTTIVEGSSGNTGVAIAAICGALGLKCKIFMQNHRSRERVALMKYFGAEIVLTDGYQVMSHVWEARKFVLDNPIDTFLVNQHGNPLNWGAHYQYTAEEVLTALNGNVDVLVSGVGTGGALVGLGKRFKEHNPNCKVIQVEPTTFVTKIEGLLRTTGNERLPEIYQSTLVDEIIEVPENEAFDFTRHLNRVEGILCGISSGAVAYGARRYVARNPSAGTVVCVFGDRLEKYLSTAIFTN